MKKSFFLILLALPLFATKYAGEIFELNPGVRATGFGGVGVALNSSPFGFYFNPALISEGKTGLFNYTSLFSGLATYNFIGFSKRNQSGGGAAIGISIISAGNIKGTALRDSAQGISEGNIYIKDILSYSTFLVTMSFVKKFSHFDAGVKLKILHENLAVTAGNGFGLDVGVFKASGPFALGMVIRDVTGTPIFWKGHSEYVYPSINLGATATIKKRIVLGTQFDVYFEGRERSATYNVGRVSFEPHFGFEYRFKRHAGVRIGIDRGRFTFGFGFSVKRLIFDYGYVGHADLGPSNKFSVAFKF